MAFPEDVLAPATGALETVTGLGGTTALVPALVLLTELSAQSPITGAVNTVKGAVTSASTLANSVSGISNPAGPLGAVNTTVTGAYNAAVTTLATGPLGAAATAVVTSAGQLPIAPLASTITGALSTADLVTAIGAPLGLGVVSGVVPLDGFEDIIDSLTDALDVTGGLPAVLTSVTALQGTLFNTGNTGILSGLGPLGAVSTVANAVRTAIDPANPLGIASGLVNAVHSVTNTAVETGQVSTLVNSVLGAAQLQAFPLSSAFLGTTSLGYVNNALGGVLGVVNPALNVVTGASGAGEGILGGLGGITDGLPGGDILDGLAIPDLLGADSPLGILDGLLGGEGGTGDPLALLTGLLGGEGGAGDPLALVTGLLGGEGGAGDPLAPVTGILGGEGSLLKPVGDLLFPATAPLRPVVDTLNTEPLKVVGEPLVGPEGLVTNLTGSTYTGPGVSGGLLGGDLLAPVTDILAGAGGEGDDPLAAVTDLLGEDGIVGGLLGGLGG